MGMHRWIRWVNDNQDAALDLMRIYLGIGLFVRGVLFMGEAGLSVETLASGADMSFASAALMHYVTLAHLVGGICLAIGLLTRIAALVQVPILFGAVFLVHVQDGLLTANQSLEFAALVLFLLVIIALFGAGRWSIDHYLFVREKPSYIDNKVAALFESVPDETEETRRSTEPVREGIEAERAVQTATPVAAPPERETCPCGNDIQHPQTTAEPRHSMGAIFYFLAGISAPVKEVVFWCEECGGVIKRTRDPEVVRKYRYHTQ